MLKQVRLLTLRVNERMNEICVGLRTKNRSPIPSMDGYWESRITIGEKVDAIIDYLGIEITKTSPEPEKVMAKKKDGAT